MSLRRAFAFVILAAFLAGPASRLECLLSCGGVVEVTERTESCHSEEKPGPALGAGADHCVGEALPVALIAKRGGVQSHQPGTAPARVPVSMAPRSPQATVTPPRLEPAPPLTALLVPLRI